MISSWLGMATEFGCSLNIACLRGHLFAFFRNKKGWIYALDIECLWGQIELLALVIAWWSFLMVLIYLFVSFDAFNGSHYFSVKSLSKIKIKIIIECLRGQIDLSALVGNAYSCLMATAIWWQSAIRTFVIKETKSTQHSAIRRTRSIKEKQQKSETSAKSAVLPTSLISFFSHSFRCPRSRGKQYETVLENYNTGSILGEIRFFLGSSC